MTENKIILTKESIKDHESILRFIEENKRKSLLKKLIRKLRISALIPIGVWYTASRRLPFDLLVNPDVAKGITSVGKYLSHKYIYKGSKKDDWGGLDEVVVDFYEYTDLLRTMFDGFTNFFEDEEFLKKGGKLILRLHDDSKDLEAHLKSELKILRKVYDCEVEVPPLKDDERETWGSLKKLKIDFYENTDLYKTLFDGKEKLKMGGKLVINLYNDNKRLYDHLKSELWLLNPERFNYEVVIRRLEDMIWDGRDEVPIEYTKDIILYNELIWCDQPLRRDGKLILDYYGNDKIIKHQVKRDEKRFSKYFDIEVNHFEEWDGKDEINIIFYFNTNLCKLLFSRGRNNFLKKGGLLKLKVPFTKYVGNDKKKKKNVHNWNKMLWQHLNKEIARLKPKCYSYKIKVNDTYI